ncbi:hypothetical protein G4228_006723 [Cervus hanglu yarkandensis]|nr:hypothetical protein G4228_006723 [Cervus hanglu yarkandensis]
MQAELERQERKKLLIARERLAFHRHRLERERMERERLERERRRVEHERRREQERIHHEREELRRQQELRYEQERRPAVRRPYDYGRRDDAYWPEAKRAALDERYHSDFNRQDRFHDFDHRDRGRYPDHSVDRSATHPGHLIHVVFCFLFFFALVHSGAGGGGGCARPIFKVY